MVMLVRALKQLRYMPPCPSRRQSGVPPVYGTGPLRLGNKMA
jgi:hypothetical protein